MGNTNIFVDYNNGDPALSQNGFLDLQYNDTVSLLLRGFPGNGYEIYAVSFFGNKVVNGADTKDEGTPRGTWTRDGGPSVEGHTVTANGNNVTIKDTEDTATDDKFWYGIEIKGPNNADWMLDPELINKGRPK